jgi:purine-binding chemotaxis protein CheW
MKKEIGSLLKSRAVALASDPVQTDDNLPKTEVLEFTLGTENYAVESAFVTDVYPLKDFTSLPGVPAYILGIVNVHGKITPLVDLKKYFNLPRKGLGELNKVIIISNGIMEFGILADEVIGTRIINIGEILPVPPPVAVIGEKYLKGVTKDQLIILSAENILSDEKMVVNEEI